MIKKTPGKEEWCVFDSTGQKKLGCHPTEEAAAAQLRAIEANKHQHSYDLRLEGVEIFATGKHNGDTYTTEDLDAMVEAFGALDFKPPLKAGHVRDTPGMPALGWVSNLRRVGEKLVADFTDMPQLVYDAVKDKLYNTVSAEVYWNLERAGKKFSRALKAVALLGADIPAVANLRPLHEMFTDDNAEVHYGNETETKAYKRGNIQALIDSFGDWAGDSFDTCVEHLSGKEGIDDPKRLCAWMHKEATGKWPAEKQHSEKEIDMNEEELKKFVGDAIAAAIAPVATAIADIKKGEAPPDTKQLNSDEKALRIAELESANAKAEKAAKDAKEALDAAKGTVTQNADLIRELQEENRKVRIEKIVESCRVPALRSFVRQYADLATRDKDVHVYDAAGNKKPAVDELEQFIGFVNANAQRLFSVVSTGDPGSKSEANPADEVDRRITKYREQNVKATYHDALHAVLDADPVLKADYAAAGS